MKDKFIWFPHWLVIHDDILGNERFIRKQVRLNLADINIVEEGYVYCDEGTKECLKAFIGKDLVDFYALDISLTNFKLIEMFLMHESLTSKGIIRTLYN